jgi:hypothetical protein
MIALSKWLLTLDPPPSLLLLFFSRFDLQFHLSGELQWDRDNAFTLYQSTGHAADGDVESIKNLDVQRVDPAVREDAFPSRPS